MYDILASMIILLLIIFNRELPYKRRSRKAVVSISLMSRAVISTLKALAQPACFATIFLKPA